MPRSSRSCISSTCRGSSTADCLEQARAAATSFDPEQSRRPRGHHRQSDRHDRPAGREGLRRRHQPRNGSGGQLGPRRPHRRRQPLHPQGLAPGRRGPRAGQQHLPARQDDPHAAGGSQQRHLQPPARAAALRQERLHHLRREGQHPVPAVRQQRHPLDRPADLPAGRRDSEGTYQRRHTRGDRAAARTWTRWAGGSRPAGPSTA